MTLHVQRTRLNGDELTAYNVALSDFIHASANELSADEIQTLIEMLSDGESISEPDAFDSIITIKRK